MFAEIVEDSLWQKDLLQFYLLAFWLSYQFGQEDSAMISNMDIKRPEVAFSGYFHNRRALFHVKSGFVAEGTATFSGIEYHAAQVNLTGGMQWVYWG